MISARGTERNTIQHDNHSHSGTLTHLPAWRGTRRGTRSKFSSPAVFVLRLRHAQLINLEIMKQIMIIKLTTTCNTHVKETCSVVQSVDRACSSDTDSHVTNGGQIIKAYKSVTFVKIQHVIKSEASVKFLRNVYFEISCQI